MHLFINNNNNNNNNDDGDDKERRENWFRMLKRVAVVLFFMSVEIIDYSYINTRKKIIFFILDQPSNLTFRTRDTGNRILAVLSDVRNDTCVAVHDTRWCGSRIASWTSAQRARTHTNVLTKRSQSADWHCGWWRHELTLRSQHSLSSGRIRWCVVPFQEFKHDSREHERSLQTRDESLKDPTRPGTSGLERCRRCKSLTFTNISKGDSS